MTHGRPSTDWDGSLQRELREQGGMTLRRLADQCRAAGTPVSDSQLSKVERGMCRPRPPLMKTLAEVLGVEVADLKRKPVIDEAGAA